MRRLRATTAEGLTASQLSALAHLDELGPLRLGELARREGIRPPTATRLVGPLVERGLVTRSPDPDDARGVVLALTRPGRRLLAAPARAAPPSWPVRCGDCRPSTRRPWPPPCPPCRPSPELSAPTA